MDKAALAYAHLGLRVFPLHSIRDGRCTCGLDCGKNAGKHPRVKGGFKVATTDAEQIEAWWRKWPDANIAIATGIVSGIIVADIDGTDGLAFLKTLVDRHGALSRTANVKTARGWHLYFAMPEGCPPIACSTGNGLDVRGDGGYCVAPPSRHASGHIYAWQDDTDEFAVCADWLTGWASSRTGTARQNSSPVENLGPQPTYLTALPNRNLTDQAITSLKRFLSLSDIEAAVEILPNPDLSWDEWNKVLMLLWAVSNGEALESAHTFSNKSKKHDPAETERRWREISKSPPTRMSVGSLIFKVRQVMTDWIPPSERTAPLINVDAAGTSARDAQSPVREPWRDSIVSAANLQTMRFDPLRYVLPRFIPEGLTVLAGRPKVGKSWLVLDLCLAVGSDRVTLGSLKPVQGDVLYLALEDGKRRLQKRLDKLLPTFSSEWPERLKLVPMGGWRRADQGGLDDIEAWCRSVAQPTLIVIDTLERFRKPANGKASLYSTDYEAIAGLQKIAEKYQIAIVVLHHDRKSDADDAFDTVSGTLGLTGAADTILIIKRRSNGVVLHARGRDIEDSETAMQFDKVTCRWTILGLASEVLRSNDRARVIAALTAAGQALSVGEIMADAEMPNRNAVDILLGKMVRDGEIVRVGRGRYDLSPKINGQIGQKERFDGKTTDSIEKNGNLSNLSDLSARTDQPPFS